MLDAKMITGPADLYRLTKEDLLKLPLTKQTMAEKLLHNIQQSKRLPLQDFLTGLGISGMGTTSWKSLLNVFPSLSLLRSKETSDFEKITGFAERTAQQIASGLADKGPLIDELLSAGVQPIDWVNLEANTNAPLQGLRFVITGTMSKPRKDIISAIENAGGQITGSISKETSALVIADPTSKSSKAEKARTLEIELWSEEELWEKLGIK